MAPTPALPPSGNCSLRRRPTSQTILIRGAELWRNPQVYVGDQRASFVEVLPDMRGLLATFDKLSMPPAIGSAPQRLNLTVITSGGLSVLSDTVTLIPAAAGGSGPPKASIVDTFISGGSPLQFH